MTNFTSVALSNEADVEQKIVYPLLTSPAWLAIDPDAVKPKSYLAPTQLDKESGRRTGYYPDFSVWMLGVPVLLVEAKDPEVSAKIGFREACLYARHLNSRYPTNVNPCRFIIATNGIDLLAGYWDQEKPVHEISVAGLMLGAKPADDLVAFCQASVLESHAKACLDLVGISRGIRPFNIVGGAALLNAKRPLNSFAADLSPVLRRYFSSSNPDNIREIAERAYVSSSEITEYDRVLEALLKDRVSARRDTIVQPIRTQKNEEPALTKAIHDFAHAEPNGGQLQIIQGAVGSGKSLFARRYRELLEPKELKAINHWAFVDFNSSPASLKDAEEWLCESFITSFERENPSLAVYDGEVLRGIFSRRIQQRRAYYEQLRAISPDEETRARAIDIVTWQSDIIAFAEGIANYVMRITQRNLVVVMDNVDKLDLQNQLDAFQLTLWFLERSKAFIILQMRDETYERYKNKPPLDTFRAGIAFHIAPPRFIDVVKRRMELGVEYLALHAPEKQEYTLDNGARVILPKGELGNFLKSLYSLIFGRRTNVARVLEALAGRDVRRALEMFASIVTSGHLSTSAITSNVRGEGAFPISEHQIILILMRTDYRFFSDTSGYISNIFYYDNDWVRSDNFLLIEILYFLAINRKKVGEIGLEGYFAVGRVCDEIQKLGYDKNDALKGVNHLLRKQLIIADHFNFSEVRIEDAVKIQASGFIHLRVLCERIEYLYGVIPVTPVADDRIAAQLADYLARESLKGFATAGDKVRAVEALHNFLKREMERLREQNPFFDPEASGARYVLNAMERTIRRYYNLDERAVVQPSALDLI
jgi:hypothetical protein